MIFVSVWPTSLSIMPSRATHILANNNVLFLLKAELSYNWILKCSVILSNLGASSLFLWFFKARFNSVETLIFSEVTSTLSHTLFHKLFLHKVFFKCLIYSYTTNVVPTLLHCLQPQFWRDYCTISLGSCGWSFLLSEWQFRCDWFSVILVSSSKTGTFWQ